MKFIVSSLALLKQLQQIAGVINSNSVLPILDDFLFDIQPNKLSVVATDLETVMKVSLSIEASEKGKVCIPAKILMESLKNIADQPLTFNVDSSFAIEITSESGKYKIMGENPDNFPKAPQAEDANSFVMTSGALVNAINKTLFAISTDDTRPAMAGVYFELEKTSISFVATDAHRLVRFTLSGINSPKKDSFIVPKKPLSLLKSALPENEDEIELSFNDKHLFVTHGSTELICRLVDARFPDYKVVIPADNPYTLTVRRTDFQNALKRVNVFSNKSSNQIVLNIIGNELQLSAQDMDYNFEGNERMDCQFDGGDLQIAFNGKFLIEMLNSAETDEIKIALSTPSKAGIIKPAEQNDDEDLLMLVMPLMVK